MARAVRIRHLTGRFLGSIAPPRTRPDDEERIRAILSPAEYAVWGTLGRADRAEAVAVGRRAAASLAPGSASVWVAAALLHDVGKVEARLGTGGRVVATLVGAAAGPGRAVRLGGRIGCYLRHAEIGAERLTEAGARPETAAWARVHHRPDLWAEAGVPDEIGRVLARADGESEPGPRPRVSGGGAGDRRPVPPG